MLHTLVQVILAVSVAGGMHISLMQPHPVLPAKAQRKMVDDVPPAYRCAELVTYFSWVYAVIETILIIKDASPASAMSTGVDAVFGRFILALQPPRPVSIPPVRMIGALLVLAAGLVRWLCYRELGHHFTFRVAILVDHSLVTTGPYGVVRHPSYTGLALMVVGSAMWHGTTGSWLLESALYEERWALLFLVPTGFLYTFIMTILVLRRPIMEDRILKKEFGIKWDRWAKAVPWRLVPGLY